MEIIADYDILSAILAVIDTSEDGTQLFLVTPYLDMNENVFRAVKRAIDSRKQVSVVIRRNVDKRPERDIKRLTDIGVKVYQTDNLHAKMYWSESAVIVTSMNLLQSSINNSLEIGLVFDERKYIKTFHEIIEEWISGAQQTSMDSTARHVSAQTPRRSPIDTPQPSRYVRRSGFCIRCGKSKTYNPKYPLCDDCYDKWAQYKNKDYKEKACHGCGTAIPTASVARPLCTDCYRLDPFDRVTR